jgi:hypothetical protein
VRKVNHRCLSSAGQSAHVVASLVGDKAARSCKSDQMCRFPCFAKILAVILLVDFKTLAGVLAVGSFASATPVARCWTPSCCDAVLADNKQASIANAECGSSVTDEVEM